MILAGGLSERMGRDKARLRIHGRSLLAWTRDAARALGVPVRVQRRDLVPRCGPLGGVYTALRRTRARAVLFLACDMPLVSAGLLRRVARALGRHPHGPRRGPGRAAFVRHDGHLGFPFIVPTDAAPEIRRLIDTGRLSLREMAERLGARAVRAGTGPSLELLNANTPDALAEVRRHLRR